MTAKNALTAAIHYWHGKKLEAESGDTKLTVCTTGFFQTLSPTGNLYRTGLGPMAVFPSYLAASNAAMIRMLEMGSSERREFHLKAVSLLTVADAQCRRFSEALDTLNVANALVEELGRDTREPVAVTG